MRSIHEIERDIFAAKTIDTQAKWGTRHNWVEDTFRDELAAWHKGKSAPYDISEARETLRLHIEGFSRA